MPKECPWVDVLNFVCNFVRKSLIVVQ